MHMLLRPLLFLTLIFLLTGCAGLSVTGQLPAGAAVKRVAPLPAGAPFAPSAAGTQVALARDGLRLIEVNNGGEQQLDSASPAALAWSVDDQRLAAAFIEGGESRIQLFGPDGTKGAVTRIPGFAATLAWRASGEVLALVTTLKVYSFGGAFAETLYRWDGTAAPVATRLHDATVRPHVMRQQGPGLLKLVSFSLSPWDDEIAYAKLQDPPEFNTYLRVVLRHLESGSEHEVANVSLASGKAVYTAADRLLVSNGTNQTTNLDPWLNKEFATYLTPGRNIAAADDLFLIDGRLYHGTEQLAAFPGAGQASFAANGSRLFIEASGTLYLVSGLPTATTSHPSPRQREALLTLRGLRSKGLITLDEYQTASERILHDAQTR